MLVVPEQHLHAAGMINAGITITITIIDNSDIIKPPIPRLLAQSEE